MRGRDHLCNSWQPIYITSTLRISKMFVINTVALTSYVYVLTVNEQPNNGIEKQWNDMANRQYTYIYICMCLFPLSLNYFRVSLNVLVGTPGGTLTPGWESLFQTLNTQIKDAYPFCQVRSCFLGKEKCHFFRYRSALGLKPALSRE